MTDTSKQELIEKAAKAILDAAETPDSVRDEQIWEWARRDARAALAVFEQAHTPSFAEALESLPTPAGCSGIGLPADDEMEAARAYADAEYPELRLAPENEDRADIAERAFLAGAGFRRTAVQEPSAHDGDCEADWGSEGQESPCRCAERAQGEPTEAQVRKEVARREEYAEAHGYPAFQDEGSAFIDGAEYMRVALRAAYEARGEGR